MKDKDKFIEKLIFYSLAVRDGNVSICLEIQDELIKMYLDEE